MISDYGEIDDNLLRRWAFDEDMELAQQDEDLLLHAPEYVPVLVSLADDLACPKAEYILGILDFYTMNLVLRGASDELAPVDLAAGLAERASREELRQWGAAQRRRLGYRAGIGEVDAGLAMQMGNDLLIGLSKIGGVAIKRETETVIEVEWVPGASTTLQEQLVIEKATGRFRYLRSYGQRWLEYGPTA